MTENEALLIERLNDHSLSEHDVSSCISTLEILLSSDALTELCRLINDSTRSLHLRQEASLAIYHIGTTSILKDLREFEKDGSPDLRMLATVALTGYMY